MAQRASAFDEGLEVVTLGVGDFASTVGAPKCPRRLVQLIRIAATVDGLTYRACDRAERLLRYKFVSLTLKARALMLRPRSLR
jgi:hypothetical protein